jgi:hypothetical protein
VSDGGIHKGRLREGSFILCLFLYLSSLLSLLYLSISLLSLPLSSLSLLSYEYPKLKRSAVMSFLFFVSTDRQRTATWMFASFALRTIVQRKSVVERERV